jgi:hypothetical protein
MRTKLQGRCFNEFVNSLRLSVAWPRFSNVSSIL